jgi:predicted PurR-regulated permease PerM
MPRQRKVNDNDPVKPPGAPDLLTAAARRWPYNPPWSGPTRLWALTFTVLAILFVWWQVRQFTGMVVLAFLLTYILAPIIDRVQRHGRLNRFSATAIVYLGLAGVLVIVAVLLGRGVVSGLATVNPRQVWDETVMELFQVLPPQLNLLGRTLDLQAVYRQMQQDLGSVGTVAIQALRPMSVDWVVGAATTVAFIGLSILVTFFTSFYLSLDGQAIRAYFEGKTPPDYRAVLHELLREINSVWQDFFRGQLILALTVGVMTVIGLFVLGVQYALTLGLIAGVLEVVPRVGPVLSTVPAVVVALVHPSRTLPGLPTPVFVLLVIGLYILIQASENNILVPRILGGSVNLPPAVMLVGALAGAALGGVVGILLAAPILGSLRVIGSWLYYQLVRPDLAPAPLTVAGADPANDGSQAAGPER